MRPKTLILFVVAVGCGLIASIGVSQYMEKARESGSLPLETRKIYVACTEINIGEKLDEKNIKLEEWPKDRVPEGAISELSELEEKYPRSRLYTGEPILIAKLSDEIDGNKAQTIPDGFRVVAVKVSAETGLGGLIRPGDRVDVVVFLRKSAEIPETKTQTILRDVNVFAVDAETERAVDKGTGQSREVRTVSLLVKPNQAESVMLAKELGIMSLTLRRPNDTNETTSDGQTVHSLLGAEADSANGSKPVSAPANSLSGLSNWLNATVTQPTSVPPQSPAVKPVAVVPPKFVMKIRTPNGDREYYWRDLNGEPEEADLGSPQNPPPAPAPAPPAQNPKTPDSKPQGVPGENGQGASETDEVADETAAPDSGPVDPYFSRKSPN